MTTKTVFLFHPLTGVFDGVYEAQESPLEPGEFLIPVASTVQQPPGVAERQVAVFRNGAWSVVADFRGVTYWLAGVATTIEEIDVSPPPGSTPDKTPPSLAAFKDELVARVDDTVGAIYSRFTRFETEYVQREGAALAFRAAGYTGDAGSWVTTFATNAGLTSQAAADLIIQQADQLRGALELLAAQRMRKYGITAAADAAAAQALHDDIIAQASVIAAGL